MATVGFKSPGLKDTYFELSDTLLVILSSVAATSESGKEEMTPLPARWEAFKIHIIDDINTNK